MKFIWADDLRDMLSLGAGEIRRASHVEPTVDNRWGADLTPFGGPILGPFETHGEAIRAEVAWIQNKLRGL